MSDIKNKKSGFAPAITLMLMAPLLTEVLPGATRFSSIFVFPIEMCVWGGGALLIRYAVRRWQLGWLSLLLLAVALAVAEECLIQQTSLAPMVIHLKGVTYARAFGVNYVYFAWALIYEPVFVVVLPIYLVELIFADRREGLWISKGGFFAVIPLFILGSFLAWFSWTQIARPKVFHIPAYHPPLAATIIAFLTICSLIFIAIGALKNSAQRQVARLKQISPWLLGLAGALWATILFGIVLLGFGIAPWFPPVAAIGIGLLLEGVVLYLLSRWPVDAVTQFAVIFGTVLGSMLAGQIGFMDTTGPDLYFKIITNIIAVVLLVMLGVKKQDNKSQESRSN